MFYHIGILALYIWLLLMALGVHLGGGVHALIGIAIIMQALELFYKRGTTIP